MKEEAVGIVEPLALLKELVDAAKAVVYTDSDLLSKVPDRSVNAPVYLGAPRLAARAAS